MVRGLFQLTNSGSNSLDHLNMADELPVEKENYTLTVNGKVVQMDDYDDMDMAMDDADYENAYFFNLDKTTMSG